MPRMFESLIFLKNRELDELYISIGIRSFAIAMISVFIPIFLYNIGYSLKEIFLFYIMFSVFRIIFTIIAGKFSSRFGFKHSMLLSNPLLIATLLLLFSIEIYSWPLWLIACVDAVSSSLFWVGYHVDFSKSCEKGKRNKALGTAKIFMMILKSIGPILGGLIAALFGFKVLFIIVSILLAFSAVPLFFSKDIHQPLSYSIKKLFLDLNVKKMLACMANGIDTCIGLNIWPLFVFLFIINNYSIIGGISSLSLFLSLLATIFISRMPDAKSGNLIKLSAMANFALNFCRIGITTVFGVIVVDIIYWLNRIGLDIAFDSKNYEKAGRGNTVEWIVLREITMHLGHVAVFLILILTSNFLLSFLVGAVTSPLLFFY